MRILIATQSYGAHTNGQGVFAHRLSERLAAKGHDVQVMLPSERLRTYCTQEKDVQMCAVAALPLAPLVDPDVRITPWPGRWAGRLIDEFQPDVVHIQDHYPLCRSVMHAARERDLATVGTNHFLPDNMTAYVPLITRFSATREAMRRWLWKLVLDVYNQADVVTAPTETAASILRGAGIQPQVRAISNGVDLEHFHPDPDVNRDGIRRQYGLDPDRAVFLYVGRVDKEKGLELLLRAAAQYKHLNFQVAIAGEGNHVRALKGLAEDLALKRHVVFTGFVPGEDLPLLLNSIDVFVMPSQVELQSIATLEAMATGRPVLAADARALPELVDSGVNGYLFRGGDVEHASQRMAQLLDERARWREMGAASLRKVQPHSLENTVRQYTALYRALCQTEPGDGADEQRGLCSEPVSAVRRPDVLR